VRTRSRAHPNPAHRTLMLTRPQTPPPTPTPTRCGKPWSQSALVQEETRYLGIPSLTVRPNTERPITIEVGTNRLVASERASIVATVREALSGQAGRGRVPELWDGRTAGRIVQVAQTEFSGGSCRQ
jgi:UDP-N-acetylglucosamine 2-epimerase